MREAKRVLLTTAVGIVVAVQALRGASPSQQATVKLIPSTIQMGTFYGGAKVRVEGVLPSGSKVVVVVRGPEVTEVFNKVGRVGPIWISTGKVTISGVPSLLLVFSSEPICDCLCRREMDRYQCDAASIKRQIHIEPQAKAEDSIAEDFLKLKVRQGSYQLSGGGIRTAAPEQALIGSGTLAMASESTQTLTSDSSRAPYALEFSWPKSAATGTYVVTVLVCRDGEVKESLEVPLKVIEVGFPAIIASLARERASTYGIISVIVAMLAGFGIDFIASRLFKKKIGSH